MSPNGRQLVHHRGDFLRLYHGTHGNPAVGLKSVDGWRAFPRRNLDNGVQIFAMDVVLAKNVLLCGWPLQRGKSV